MPVAVEFINVTKRFGKLTAVENINLKVNDGEVVALVGPNGAGKTTLLRMAAGVLLPDAGKVLIHGIEAHRAEAKWHVGFMTPMDRGVYWRGSPATRTTTSLSRAISMSLFTFSSSMSLVALTVALLRALAKSSSQPLLGEV